MISSTGKCSWFGGPADTGVSSSEELALIEPVDLSDWWFRYLFLKNNPPGTTGLARRLDPDAYYCAMRWDYSVTPREFLRRNFVTVSANGISLLVRPVDWGPNADTDRLIDCSPGILSKLRVKTDDLVTVSVPSP